MNDALVLQNLAGFTEVIANVRLCADPINVATDPLAEINGRVVSGRASKLGIAGKMTHFAGTKFTIDLRRDADLQEIGKLFGDFANRRAAAAADVQGKSV